MTSDEVRDIEPADPSSFGHLDAWDYASWVLDDFDYAAQLHALHGLMAREREHARAREEAIAQKQASLKTHWSIQGSDDLIDHFHWSVHHDAVQSMISVAALTTFIEALFRRAFSGIKARYEYGPLRDNSHPRWTKQPTGRRRSDNWDPWDCSSALRGGGIAAGIIQLAKATGLFPELPNKIAPTIAALFEYRNFVFHNGFEWPLAKRDEFERLMASRNWPPDWFTRATSDDKLWVLYLSDAFVVHSMEMLPEVIEGLGIYVRKSHDVVR